MITYESIPKLIGSRCFSNPVSIPLKSLEYSLKEWAGDYGLNLNPDFQRGHVWVESQQIKFIEYILKGGDVPAIVFNSPAYAGYDTHDNRDLSDEIVIVDGLQRLTAILKFLHNELPVFGNNYLDDFSDKLLLTRTLYVKISVNHLQTRKELLQWYLEMNEGHIAHSQEELDRVRNLIGVNND